MERILVIASFPESILQFRGLLLGSLVSAGADVHLAAPGVTRLQGLEDKLAFPPGRLHDLPLDRNGTNALGDVRLLFGLVRLMRKTRPAAVLPYTIKPVVYGTLAAWFAGVPRRYALITGLGYAFTGERRGLLSRIIMSLYRMALKRATKVFFQNPDDERQFRALGLLPAGVPSVVVNGSGVDVAEYAVRPLPTGAMAFLMIGRLLGDKGVREYVQAARKVKMLHPEARFRLVGWIDSNPDAIGQPELDGWISEGTIEFLGRLDDVRPAIADASVYVLPSYREGTPRTVLEAMAMGRAILTTHAPGCRETVVDGDNGRLVPVKSVDGLVEAMLGFIDNPQLAARMGERSRQIAEAKYDVHKVNAVMLREMGFAPPHENREHHGS